MEQYQTQVAIVGCGPVGMTLAMMLSRYGVSSIIIEQRWLAEPPSVKSNHVSARSMEIFRRLGVVSQIRNAGLPEEYPNDISYRTSMTGLELSRIHIPCRRDRYTDTTGPDGNWHTPEPPHRINQIYLEPILFANVISKPNIVVLNCTMFEELTQDANGVTIVAQQLDSKKHLTVSAQYLVGCDGGKSDIRHAIGATLEGTPIVQRVQSTYIYAPTLANLQKVKPAWASFSLNPRRSGNVYAIDGHEKWLIHNYLRDNEADFDAVDRDWSIRTILGVDDNFEYTVLSKEDWFGRRLVANRFRDRRVFICGDAAHIWVPYAGYGMNAGIADAENLGWLLSAHLNGWAEATILNAYERERHPITEQVSFFAMNHAHAMAKQRAAVPVEIEDETTAGELAREKIGKAAYELNVQQYCAAGLNFGYFYDRSPLIVYDEELAPSYSMGSYTPSTVPGCRTPHIWLKDGRSLYDAVGRGYTLLRFDPNVNVSNMLNLAKKMRFPITLLDIALPYEKSVYTHKLVLSRPDLHIAWRGNTPPHDLSVFRGQMTH